jgi:hypothetical protein
MTDKNDLVNIFNDIKNDEINNDLYPKFSDESDLFTYKFQESHYLFINNVTIAFNKVHFDNGNLRFYIDDITVGAVAILNIEEIIN